MAHLSATVALLPLFLQLILAGATRNPIRLPSDRAAESNGLYRQQVDKTYSGSHVMQHGERALNSEKLKGSNWNPANDNATFIRVSQPDAGLFYLWYEYVEAPVGSPQKLEFLKELVQRMSYRIHLDNTMELIGMVLFGSEQGSNMLKTYQPTGPVVDDWFCHESMVMTFEKQCGSLSQYDPYGLEHRGYLANICNAGISVEKMAKVSAQVCISSMPNGPWRSLKG